MSITASTQALSRLEPYLLLAKSAKSAAAAKLIAEATAAPGCYVFSELLDIPNVRELSKDAQHASSYRLLELFAYGTLSDYVNAAPDTYPALNEAQVAKLRHLTLVTLASQSRNLSYAILMQQLSLEANNGNGRSEALPRSGATTGSAPGPSRPIHTQAMRQLEDVIIDAIYAGVLSARLDQQRQRVEVESAMGRDVRGKEAVAQLATALAEWQQTTTSMVTMLSQRIDQARQQDIDKARQRDHFDEQLCASLSAIVRKEDSATSEAGGAGSGSGHGTDLRAAYDRTGGERFNGEMDIDEEGGVLRKKKASAAGPMRSKRSRP